VVPRLRTIGDSSDEEDDVAVPLGYIQDRNPSASATRSHRIPTIDADNILVPKRSFTVRSGAWNPETASRTRTRTSRGSPRGHSEPTLGTLRREGHSRDSGCSSDGVPARLSTAELDAKEDKEERERRAAEHEIRRLRRKVEEMERRAQEFQMEPYVRRTKSLDVPGGSSTSTDSDTEDSSDAPSRTKSASAASSDRPHRLSVKDRATRSEHRLESASASEPAAAGPDDLAARRKSLRAARRASRVQREGVTAIASVSSPAATAAAITAANAAARSPAAAKAIASLDEPWGSKPDAEPQGLYGKYEGENFQSFIPLEGDGRLASLVKFMTSATPPDVLSLCKITRIRDRSGTTKRKPAYSFVLQSGGTGGVEVPLLETKRIFKGKHVYYEFWVGDTANKTYLGKLKCNFSAKKFTLFDSGVKVTKNGMIPVAKRDCQFREELAKVGYTKTTRGPRQLVATLPSLAKTGSGRGALFLVNKIPAWDPELRVHTLKYHHRATEKSVKNFQLVADGSKQRNPPVLLRFGKVASNSFNLDFRGPLTPLHAIAFSMTAFEKNWAEGIVA